MLGLDIVVCIALFFTSGMHHEMTFLEVCAGAQSNGRLDLFILDSRRGLQVQHRKVRVLGANHISNHDFWHHFEKGAMLQFCIADTAGKIVTSLPFFKMVRKIAI